ncbi:golgin subfamily A member 6-like protein 22 [Osmerus eperlanus]|uniref:golgin subfamily A member 6-like protein 22 n=2 Tax=Osmerus TaxID=8013 RepID=UPI002E103055
MALRAKSHGDLQTLSSPGWKQSMDSRLYKSFSLSNGNDNGGGGPKFGTEASRDGAEEGVIKGHSRPLRRPVRAVRPLSALSASGSFLQINHLQGELVRKRKECEDLRKENKYLSNEIHMERIMMRTENELTMRNLRNLNQELQAQVKELKQKVYFSQQRATLCSRAADEADMSRGEAETSRALAEARALGSNQEREQAQAGMNKLSEELQQLKKEHTDVQLLLAKTEKNYFETKLKLDRVSGEKHTLLGENQSLEGERNELRHKLRQLTEENVKIKEKEVSTRRRALTSEEQRERAERAQLEADQERRVAERERQERTAECLGWREKHQNLTDIFRAQEDLKSQRQNKACQANIKSYFLCMTESDQRVKILKNQDGTPRNFTEGDPVYISTPEPGVEDADRSPSRTMLRVTAPRVGKDQGPSHFSDLAPMAGDMHEASPTRRGRKVVEYFWIPTDEE